MHVLEAICSRRSIARLVEPAPDEADLRTILEAAACAPDHGKLRPFRFTVLRGEHADAFGTVLEDAYRARCRDQGTEVVPAKAA
ncbi:MAG TPA: nitroreductase family protein, partial [Acidimicrobiales bacterium]|nr:nitroreductase family protein [Acidimicrobiales bacterium]